MYAGRDSRLQLAHLFRVKRAPLFVSSAMAPAPRANYPGWLLGFAARVPY